MSITYKHCEWEFNAGAWSQLMKEAADRYGIELVALTMNVTIDTVKVWQKSMTKKKDGYPYPRMTNFIMACQEFDVDPRDFFCLPE